MHAANEVPEPTASSWLQGSSAPGMRTAIQANRAPEILNSDGGLHCGLYAFFVVAGEGASLAQLTFEDGSGISARLVVGADGANSRQSAAPPHGLRFLPPRLQSCELPPAAFQSFRCFDQAGCSAGYPQCESGHLHPCLDQYVRYVMQSSLRLAEQLQATARVSSDVPTSS